MIFLFFLACTAEKSDGATPTDSGASSADDTAADTGAPPVSGCHATPAAADRERLVVVSFPYDDDANEANRWVAYRLSSEGALSDTGQDFTMGRAWLGTVEFTPDAEFGYALQDDGSIGVFADDGATVTVVDPAWDGGIYPSALAVDPSGEALYVVDGNWQNNGGGLYTVPIDCETGALGAATLLFPSKLPAAVLRGATRLLVASLEVPGTVRGDDLALLDLADPAVAIAGVDAFGDDDTVIADADRIGAHVLLADNAEFFGHPTRVAVIAQAEAALTRAQNFDVEDPVALVPSPFGDQLLILSGYGDAIQRYAYDPDGAEPLTALGALSAAERPALPGAAAWIRRGALEGLVLVSEAEGLRWVQLDADGGATDLGRSSPGVGLSALPGAVGIAP